MHIEEKQFKDFILDSGLVSKADFTDAEKSAKEKDTDVGEILVSQGKIGEDELRKIQANILGIPFVDLKGTKIDFDVLALIPEPIARNHNIVGFKKVPGGLEVAMLDIANLTAIDFVKKKVGLKILPRLTDRESIKSVLLQYQKSLKAEFGDLIQKESVSIKTVADGGAEGED
nr:hypothetical protein [Saprospiraceae bacterium]